MTHDPDLSDPHGTLETVPPPQGAKDPYSAQTRVGTLVTRTKSGTQRSAASPLAAPNVRPHDACSDGSP